MPRRHLSQPDSEELSAVDANALARTIVLRKLAASAKSRAELEEILRKKNIPEEVIAAVLDRYTEVGLIDDQLYATIFAKSRHEYNGFAARAIGYQLANKGVQSADIDVALGEITPDVELARAIKLAEKKAKSISGLDTVKKLNRIVGMLARKGYSSMIAYQAAKHVLGANEIVDQDIDLELQREN
jgi:regulatory protein